MTQRERVRDAAKWRRIAQAFERGERRGIAKIGLRYAAVKAFGLCYYWDNVADPMREVMAPRPGEERCWWPLNREGDDYRVIAAGLLAAMCEAGDLG